MGARGHPCLPTPRPGPTSRSGPHSSGARSTSSSVTASTPGKICRPRMLMSASPHCSASSASAPGRSGRVVRTRQSMWAGCAPEVALAASPRVSGVRQHIAGWPSAMLDAMTEARTEAQTAARRSGRSSAPSAWSAAGRLPVDRGRRRGRGVPAPAARADPADPRRRGRVPAGRPGLGPDAGQPVRRLLRRPAAAADRALQGSPTRSAGRCSSGWWARSPAPRWWSRPPRWPGWSPTSTPRAGPRSRWPRSAPTCSSTRSR